VREKESEYIFLRHCVFHLDIDEAVKLQGKKTYYHHVLWDYIRGLEPRRSQGR